MALREQVLRCLKERALDRASEGRVFSTTEEHRQWLFGAGDGFLSNPRAALAARIAGPTGVHAGVELTGGEEGALLGRLRDFLGGGGVPMPDASGGIALECDPAIDPYCEY